MSVWIVSHHLYTLTIITTASLITSTYLTVDFSKKNVLSDRQSKSRSLSKLWRKIPCQLDLEVSKGDWMLASDRWEWPLAISEVLKSGSELKQTNWQFQLKHSSSKTMRAVILHPTSRLVLSLASKCLQEEISWHLLLSIESQLLQHLLRAVEVSMTTIDQWGLQVFLYRSIQAPIQREQDRLIKHRLPRPRLELWIRLWRLVWKQKEAWMLDLTLRLCHHREVVCSVRPQITTICLLIWPGLIEESLAQSSLTRIREALEIRSRVHLEEINLQSR